MNILITGASRGIGKAITESLIKAGHKVFVSARNEELLKFYENYCVCDLANEVEKLGEFIEAHNIEILVNNAGEYIYSPIEKMTISQIEHITKVNFEAPLYLISKAVPYMKSKKWGRIINIGSISGVMGEAGASLYSATKSGLFGATPLMRCSRAR